MLFFISIWFTFKLSKCLFSLCFSDSISTCFTQFQQEVQSVDTNLLGVNQRNFFFFLIEWLLFFPGVESWTHFFCVCLFEFSMTSHERLTSVIVCITVPKKFYPDYPDQISSKFGRLKNETKKKYCYLCNTKLVLGCFAAQSLIGPVFDIQTGTESLSETKRVFDETHVKFLTLLTIIWSLSNSCVWKFLLDCTKRNHRFHTPSVSYGLLWLLFMWNNLIEPYIFTTTVHKIVMDMM